MTFPPEPPPHPAAGRSIADRLGIADRLSLPRIHWGWLLLLIGFGALFWAARAVFAPFVGALFAVSLSLLVALGQYGLDLPQLGIVIGVFLVGQGLESSVLTPNLIGTRIGLHPVWVLFAVFAGGSVAGLAGVFLAVPVAAVLGVVLRAALAHYRTSRFCTGIAA